VNRPKYRPYLMDLRRAARQNGIPLDVPWLGSDPGSSRRSCWTGRVHFLAVHGFFALLERKKYKLHVRVMLSIVSRLRVVPGVQGAAVAG